MLTVRATDKTTIKVQLQKGPKDSKQQQTQMIHKRVLRTMFQNFDNLRIRLEEIPIVGSDSMKRNDNIQYKKQDTDVCIHAGF
jgi:hypothetical protein